MSPQHLDALARANKIRLAAAARRRELGMLTYWEGRHRLAEWIESSRPEIEPARVEHMLSGITRLGPCTRRRLLSAAGIPQVTRGERTRIRQLTPRQRRALCCALRGEPVEASPFPDWKRQMAGRR